MIDERLTDVVEAADGRLVELGWRRPLGGHNR